MAEEFEDDTLAQSAASDAAMAAQMAMTSPHSTASENYLHKHTRLLDLQIENLQKQDEFEVSHLRWRRFNDQMRGLLQMMLVTLVALVVVAVGAAVWRAYDDKGVVIDAFSVPPDMAAKGLTGEVVAKQLQDRLAALQAATYSFRAPSSYANNWGNNIKVQIPDTGVSIGEFNRYLTDWLGSETHITGEIWRTESGIAVTARAGSDVSPTFTGSEADLGALIQKAAEAVYGSTQPYRYGIYLSEHGKYAEATEIFETLIRTGSPEDRSWAHIGLSNPPSQAGQEEIEVDQMRQAIAAMPDNVIAWHNLASDEGNLQHDEQALSAARKALALVNRGGTSGLNPYYSGAQLPFFTAAIDQATGDEMDVLAKDRQIEAEPDRHSWEDAYGNDLQACAALHDSACVQAAWAAFPKSDNPGVLLSREGILAGADVTLERWHDVAMGAAHMLASLEKIGPPADLIRFRFAIPLYALTFAQLGDLHRAHAMIDSTPRDCVVCLRMRGRIDALERNWNGANYWFANAVSAAPSVPFGYTDWGQALLAKGDFDAAIAKFTLANLKGPHFADPLEMWGEALIRKNRSDLALAKFAEAEKYAPHWGRLHLKWGEALFYAGMKDEARKQFAIASGLDLALADKLLFAQWMTRHG